MRNRRDVITAIRTIMCSAHRNNIDRTQIMWLLTDENKRNLARQIATGRNGGRLPKTAVTKLLTKHWAETKTYMEEAPRLTRQDGENLAEIVLTELEHSALNRLDKAIVSHAATLAGQYGTTRPAMPVRATTEALKRQGLNVSDMTVHRAIGRLCQRGEWLALAQRGSSSAKGGRANLYHLAPLLLADALAIRE